MDTFLRERSLLGEENFNKLRNKKVAVFGLGGVGSYVVEGLARAGINNFVLCDNDAIATHNINRQLYALHSTVGKLKVEVCKQRVLDINPNANCTLMPIFFDSDTICQFDLSNVDYIADCIDTVTSKILLIKSAKQLNVPIISCMGTGNKLYTQFEVADISKTSVCPLAKIVRKLLKEQNIKGVKVVYSKEQPLTPSINVQSNKRVTPASISYVPSVAGLTLAGEIIRDLLNT